MVNAINNNVTFKARCPQIRDAQWVSHTVNTELPHFSITKFEPMIKKFVIKTLNPQKEPENLIDICMLIEPLERFMNNNKTMTLIEKFAKYIFNFLLLFNKQKKNNLNMLLWIKERIVSFGEKRQERDLFSGDFYAMNNILRFMKVEKLGNCHENAQVAELILKMNGIKNSVTAAPYTSSKEIDHVVCIFNKDDSKFYGNITNKTIIIDPWAGIADFASNTLATYKSMYKIPQNEKLKFGIFSKIDISQKELDVLKELYPEFVFKNKQRNFMENIRQK